MSGSASTFSNTAVDSAGNVYGVSQQGGTSGLGYVFEVAAGSGVVTDIGDFSTSVSPGTQAPFGVTVDASGDVFGISAYGGASGDGFVWRLGRGTHVITDLADFTSSTGSARDAQLTIDGVGNVFGMNGSGVFEIPAGSSSIQLIATYGTNAAAPTYGNFVVDDSGNRFAASTQLSAGGICGFWEVPAGSSSASLIASNLNSSITGPIAIDSRGDLFGTSMNGGPNSYGEIWELPAGSSTAQVIDSFGSLTLGAYPNGVVMDAFGNLFGSTISGGANGVGVVWEIPAGATTLTDIATFGGANASDPIGGIAIDSAGNIYGCTESGGAHGDGIVFELVRSGGNARPRSSRSGRAPVRPLPHRLPG